MLRRGWGGDFPKTPSSIDTSRRHVDRIDRSRRGGGTGISRLADIRTLFRVLRFVNPVSRVRLQVSQTSTGEHLRAFSHLHPASFFHQSRSLCSFTLSPLLSLPFSLMLFEVSQQWKQLVHILPFSHAVFFRVNRCFLPSLNRCSFPSLCDALCGVLRASTETTSDTRHHSHERRHEPLRRRRLAFSAG